MICNLFNEIVHWRNKTAKQFIDTLVDFALHAELVSDASFSLFIIFDNFKNFDATFFHDPMDSQGIGRLTTRTNNCLSHHGSSTFLKPSVDFVLPSVYKSWMCAGSFVNTAIFFSVTICCFSSETPLNGIDMGISSLGVELVDSRRSNRVKMGTVDWRER